MRCEVCGREIRGPPIRRIIEGGRLVVCAQCARFGSSEWTPARPLPPTPERPRRSEVEAVERLALVEDYGERIRAARQRENLTVEELARRVGEKESVIKNLEKEELVPDAALIQKLRSALRIELLVPEEGSSAPMSSKPTAEPTLGEIIKLRQGSKKEEAAEEAAEG